VPFIDDAGSEPSSAGTIAAGQTAALTAAIVNANPATNRAGMPIDQAGSITSSLDSVVCGIVAKRPSCCSSRTADTGLGSENSSGSA
jgi:ABC-type transporter Mla subunit MlaD